MSAATDWVRRLKWATWVLHGGLIGGLFTLVAAQGTASLFVLASLLVLPLGLAIPGLLRGRGYTASWASMLVAFYCALLLAELVVQPRHHLALLLLAIVAALDFVALILLAKGAKARDRGGSALS